MSDKSKIIRSENFAWPDLQRKEYKTVSTGYKDISRYILLGDRSDEQGLNMQTRYFEIAKGGYSSLERHRHPHTVIVVRGRGSVILDNQVSRLSFMDTVYVASGSVHQFHADQDSPLGFLCIVDRYRDRPEVPEDEKQLEDWIPDPEVRRLAKI